MQARRRLLTLILPLGFTLMAGHALVWAAGDETRAPAKSTDAEKSGYDADNTGRNVRDRSDTALTPESQQENESDLEITAAIRRAIVEDDSLSTNAQNVKIITRDQVVTLRGPVNSEAERTRVATLARQVQGVKRVDNQLELNKQ